MNDQKKQDVTQKKHLFEEEKEYSRVNPIKPILSSEGKICVQFYVGDLLKFID